MIVVLSESEFEKFDITENDIIISIVTPGRCHPRLDAKCLKRLDVEFHDTLWGEEKEDTSFLLKGTSGITDVQARDIVDFASEYLPWSKRLIVHCEAGMSRSAGVAVGLARYLVNDEEENALRDHKPHFNLFVAQKIWKVFRLFAEEV